MKLINVGIIGLGVIGKRMAQNMGVHPKFNILGGYDISEKKKSEFSNEFPEIKTYSSAEKLLRETELDLLYIGTPPASHAEYVKMSASRKLTIFARSLFVLMILRELNWLNSLNQTKSLMQLTLYIHQHPRQKLPINILLREN